MAPTHRNSVSYYNNIETRWKRQHRFGIALSLLVYAVSYLIIDYFFIDHSKIEDVLNITNLYLISAILITISSIFLIIFDTITNNNSICIRVITSMLMIIGGLIYIALVFIQSLQRHQSKEPNHLLYTLLYLTSAVFITGNSIFLGVINLMECYFAKTILLMNSLLFIVTSCGMVYFWSVYYDNSIISPTKVQIGLIQTGWIIVATICSGKSLYPSIH